MSYVRSRQHPKIIMGQVGRDLSPALQRKVADRWRGMVVIPRKGEAAIQGAS